MHASKEAIPYPGYGKKKSMKKKTNKGANYLLEDEEEAEKEEEAATDGRRSAHSIAGQLKLASEERINKVLARAGIASRRGADDMLLANRVSVNGKPVNSPGFKVDVKKDIIVVDGEKISLPDAKSTYWIAINKPKNVITSMSDDKDRETLSSLVPKSKELRLVPVGRLERDATGLMVLTNEVGWIHPMTHRSFKHHNNRYEVVVQGFVADEDIEALKIGAGQVSAEFDVLTGAVAAPVNQPSYQRKYNKHTNKMVRLPPTIVKIIDCDRKAGLTLLEVSMEELLPQQMQRMCIQVLKCPMLSIKRTEFGPIRLAGLKRAQWRELTSNEVEKLKGSVSPRRDATEDFTAGGLFDIEEDEVIDDDMRRGISRIIKHQRSGRPTSPKSKTKRPGAGYASRGIHVKGRAGDGTAPPRRRR